jgi:2-amino-4-hydroxy-6-hydroxymethyldihydropteridine diphosphokinase
VSDTAYVALGSNLGNRAGYLAAARSAISLTPGVRLIAASAVEETAPIGIVVQGPYLNQMVAVSTMLAPTALLVELQRIERGLGRVRGVRWGARTIDLDIVQHGDVRLRSDTLELPHPGLTARAFWQRERAELQHLVGT